MTKNSIARNLLYSLLCFTLGSGLFFSCSSDYEEVEVPTQGLITTVQEVAHKSYKIANEQAVQDTADSRIIANYLDNTSDTFTLAEARLAEKTGYSGHRSGIFTAASYGFFGFMMGRSMSRHRPTSSAYMDQKTYNKVNSTTGNTMRSSSTKVRRPTSRSRSGYGSSRSTRSHGG